MRDDVYGYVDQFDQKIEECESEADIHKLYDETLARGIKALTDALTDALTLSRDNAIRDLGSFGEVLPLALDHQREMIRTGVRFEETVHETWDVFFSQVPVGFEDRLFDALENADRRGK